MVLLARNVLEVVIGSATDGGGTALVGRPGRRLNHDRRRSLVIWVSHLQHQRGFVVVLVQLYNGAIRIDLDSNQPVALGKRQRARRHNHGLASAQARDRGRADANAEVKEGNVDVRGIR